MKLKKLLAGFMTLAMLVTTLPATVLADEAVTTAEALRAAVAVKDATVELGNDITVDGEWGSCAVAEGVTIDGNGHTLTVGSVVHYSANAVFYGNGSFTVKDMTFHTENKTSAMALYMKNGGTVTEVKVTGGFEHGVYAAKETVVEKCEFSNASWGVYTEGVDTLTITDTKFESLRAAMLRGDVTFTGNTVESDKGVAVVTSDATIENNTFSGDRAMEIYSDVKISNNQILGGAKVEIQNSVEEVDLSDNYWDGNAPAEDQVVIADTEDSAITTGAATIDTYYKEAATDEDGNISFSEKVDARTYVAQIGEDKFETLAEAFNAAQSGNTVTILADGTYALSTSGKDLTIKAADGVKATFDNIGAKNMGGADVTFENVAFDYYPNTTYTGLQHSGDLVYNDCTFEGQPFLYGKSETFNNCTFNQTSADAYNVWTYGSKNVTFTECTFNSAGKAVLVYKEGANASNPYFATFEKCQFNATENAGKAAIEIGSNLWSYNVTINDCTFSDTFEAASSSGNNHWNAKNYVEGTENHSITVDGTKTTVTTGADGSGNLYTVVVNETTTPEEEPTPSKNKTKKYDVIIKNADNGDVEVDDDYAKRGQEITITVDPDKGYELDELTITDQNGDEVDYEEGKKDNTFVFDMPKSDVTIEASFDKESSSVSDQDDEDKEDVSDKEDEDTSKSDDEQEYIKLTIGQKIVWLFDEYVVNDVAPEIKAERTMLPIRIIAEALGATVTWSEAEQKVTITEDDLVIEIFIGQPFATVDGEPVELDAPAYIANDRTYLPLRFVAENLGAEVVWNAADSTVTIYK